MTDTTTIMETNRFIILDEYTKIEQQGAGYQSETDLEREFIAEGLPREIQLRQQQYEYYRNLLLRFPQGGTDD